MIFIIIRNMRTFRVFIRNYFLLFFLLLSIPVFGDRSIQFEGLWLVRTETAIQVIQLYTDGFDDFTNGYRLRDDFISDPFTYISFNFIDEDLLYITRADGSTLRGFYQYKDNSGINKDDFPFYIHLEDKYENNYYFPVRETDDGHYEINYSLELGLRDILIQINCLGIMYRDESK